MEGLDLPGCSSLVETSRLPLAVKLLFRERSSSANVVFRERSSASSAKVVFRERLSSANVFRERSSSANVFRERSSPSSAKVGFREPLSSSSASEAVREESSSSPPVFPGAVSSFSPDMSDAEVRSLAVDPRGSWSRAPSCDVW